MSTGQSEPVEEIVGQIGPLETGGEIDGIDGNGELEGLSTSRPHKMQVAGKNWDAVLLALENGASCREASKQGNFCGDYLANLKLEKHPRWLEAEKIIERYRADLVPKALRALEGRLVAQKPVVAGDDVIWTDDSQAINQAAAHVLKAAAHGGFGKQEIAHGLAAPNAGDVFSRFQIEVNP